ncbi:Flp family type IVb pilin [Pseudomonas fluorescens]|nr:Flp family type IVb pilin [Pseudomonas fluorescens]
MASCRQRRSKKVFNLLMRLYVQLQVFFQRKDGATAIEYLILVAIVALVVLAAGTTLGPQITTFMGRIQTAITTL